MILPFLVSVIKPSGQPQVGIPEGEGRVMYSQSDLTSGSTDVKSAVDTMKPSRFELIKGVHKRMSLIFKPVEGQKFSF